jgi:antitoxin VapB
MGAPQLNIKDAEATRLVRELVELTGETQTEAVRKALRERLDREKADRANRDERSAEGKRREFERIWAEVQKVTGRVAAQRSGENDFTEADLYDENGLPK